jgi:hypothetical protein
MCPVKVLPGVPIKSVEYPSRRFETIARAVASLKGKDLNSLQKSERITCSAERQVPARLERCG